MRPIATALVLLACVFWPDSASALQCVSFSKDVPCAQKNGPLGGDFDGSKPKPTFPQTPWRLVPPKPLEPVHQQAIDCAMVKSPGRSATSAMRVVRPDPTVKYTLRVIVAPPCKNK